MQIEKENKLILKLNDKTTKQLVQLFIETENFMISEEIAMIRGGIMDILEHRNPTKFNDWLNAEYPNDDIKNFF